MRSENIVQTLKGGLYSIQLLYLEKGIAPLKMPLFVLIAAFLLFYMGVYTPILSKLAQGRTEMASLNASTQYASAFEGYRSWLMTYQERLPPLKDKDIWLFNAVARTSQEEGIISPSISQQTEHEMNDFIVVKRDIGAVTTFEKAAKWIARLENSPFFMRLSQFSLRKDTSRIGFVKLTFQAETVFMKVSVGKRAKK